jgi:hypothetical protein
MANGLSQNLLGEFPDQAVLLGQSDEVGRKNKTVGRVVPARENFEPDDAACAQVHQRLENGDERFQVECLNHIVQRCEHGPLL